MFKTLQKNILSRYSTELAAIPGTSFKLRLSVCVRNVPEFSGTKKDKSVSAEQCQVITKGTSAILFLLPHADTTDDVRILFCCLLVLNGQKIFFVFSLFIRTK